MEKPSPSATDNDLEELENILSELPTAIEIKLKIASLFNSIHQKMNQGLSYEVILESVFTPLDSVIPFDRIGIGLLENNNESMALRWVKSKLPIKEVNKGYKASIVNSSLKEVLSNKAPRIIGDLEDYLKDHPESESTRHILQDGIRSSLTCPLVVNDKAIGCIFFSSKNPHTYNLKHSEIFCEISQGLSLIIEQSLMKESIANNQTKEKIFRATIHDLNNPLAVIKGTLDILERKGWFDDLNDNLKKSFHTLKRNSEAMISMVNDLVQMNEIKSGKKIVHLKNCELDVFLKEIMNDSFNMAKKKNITIELERGSNLPFAINIDPEYLKRAIENLVSNAIKYSQNNTKLVINVEVTDNKLLFSFTDQGLGIPENEIDKLFKEFGKTSVKPTSGETSSGLGLANVKAIIEAHGGRVSVQSQVNVGSTFTFWIPIHSTH